MTPPPDPASRLRVLWTEYADVLDGLSSLLPVGTADRFRHQVLFAFLPLPSPRWGEGPAVRGEHEPVRDALPSPLTPLPSGERGIDLAAIRAVDSWYEFRPEQLPLDLPPTADDLLKLRDRLAELESRFETLSPALPRWLGGSPDPVLTIDADVRRLVSDCRRSMDRLSHPLPADSGIRLARLNELAREADRALADSPIDWPPAAPVRIRALMAHIDGVPFARPLARLTPRMSAALRGEAPAPESLAIEAADALIALAEPDRAEWLDRAFELFRGWSAGVELRFPPTTWSFVDPPIMDELGAEGIELIPVYKHDVPRGRCVRVKVLGVATVTKVVRPAVVTVSAGPVPIGLAELEEVLDSLSGPAVESLRDRLTGWRAASLNGSFESAAVDTFVLFWDELWPSLRESHPDGAPIIAEHLAAVLKQAAGLTPFEPSHFLEHPEGWAQVAAGRLTSGRIRQVLRPGLIDAEGKLRTPARVEVE